MFKKAIEEKFIILAISSGLTMDVENNRIMIETIESHNPSYWELHNPDGYLVYYRSKDKKSGKNSNNLYESIKELIKYNALFEEYKVGISEGIVITELDWRGRVVSEPHGGSVIGAYKKQKSKDELNRSSGQDY